MAQHDYNIANQSGADFRADLNNALSAIATVNSGASEPSTTFAHQLWVDTSNNVLKIRNAANSAFITTGVSITASNTFAGNLTGNVTGDLTGNADTATTLATARTINGVSFNGSANISFNTDSVAEGSSNLYFTNERVDDQVNALLQAGTGIQLTYDDTAGTLTIANTNDADITGVVAGNGLTGGGTAGSVTLNVAVDDSSIEIDSDALRVKASGITNTMLTGSIANSKLANSSVTINSQSLALGGTLVLDTDNIGEGSSNLYYTTARVNSAFDTRLATKDTGDLSEGSNLYFTNERVDDRVSTLIQNGTGISWSYDDTAGTLTPTISLSPFNTSQLSESGNLYFTDARARAAISENSTQLSYNSTTGVLTYTQGDTDTVSEGSNNLYYTSARANTDFDTRLATKSTSNLAEGTNLYYTTARFDSAFTSKDTDDLSEGTTNLYYTQSRFDSAFGNKTTANLTENTNLYYTDTRANSAIDARVVKSFVDALGIQATSVADNSVVLGNDTTGNYIQTVTGTANKITVSGSGSESADITLSLPDDVQIASDLTVAGNLTVNGTLTSLDTTNLDIEDNLFQLNAGLTGSPVNDSGMLINRGSSDNGIFMWDESVDKFTLGLTTADGSATGNITLSSLGTLVANLEGSVTGNITGQVSDISNFTTANLTENTNLYYTQARFDSALAAKSTTNLSEGSNLYYTDARFDTRLASKDTDDVSEGTSNLYYTSARFNSAFSSKSTSDLSEGSNLYYTDARVQAVSINNVVEDTTPQLGGNLDLNSSDITGTGDINITGTIQSSGNITGTLATAAQPNITSVGTLTALTGGTGDLNWDSGTLFVDSSANAVGIGTNSPDKALTISASDSQIRLYDADGTNQFASFQSDNGIAKITSRNNTSHGQIAFQRYNGTTVSTSMTIDNLGNLLVGKTSNTISAAGAKLGTGGSNFTRDNSEVVYVNRTTSDGSLITLAKDSTVVGSIGSYFGAMYIGSPTGTDGHIRLGQAELVPATSTGANRDNYMDLGSSSGRFKDLYLSGTGYFDTSVGIGTTSPTQALHVAGSGSMILNDSTSWSYLRLKSPNTNGGYIQFADADDDDVGQIFYYHGSGGDYMSFTTNAAERMRIDSSGNVGIGVTSPANKLDIVDSTAGFAARITNNQDSSQGLQVRTSDNDTGLYILDLQTSSSATGTNYASQFVVEKGGNVGIGETSPSKLLHITSNTDYEGIIIKGAGHKQLTIESTQSSHQALATFTTGSQNMSIGLDTDNDFIFHSGTAGSERMCITSSGTLLVSTTTASGLSNGTSNYGHSFGGGQQVNATNNDTNLILNMSNGSSNAHVLFRSDGGNTGSITTNGSAVAFNTGSDYRLKENVLPLKDGLDRLNKLNPVQFDWKKSQKTDEGFIAHEVQEIVPYVVKGEKDGEEIQTMDYGKLTPLLVKAIQEQQTQIEALQSEINLLKGE